MKGSVSKLFAAEAQRLGASFKFGDVMFKFVNMLLGLFSTQHFRIAHGSSSFPYLVDVASVGPIDQSEKNRDRNRNINIDLLQGDHDTACHHGAEHIDHQRVGPIFTEYARPGPLVLY